MRCIQQLNHFDLRLRMLKITFAKYKNFEIFPEQHAPGTPYILQASAIVYFELPSVQTSCKLSLNSTGSCVLDLLSVRRIFLVPKDWIYELMFF